MKYIIIGNPTPLARPRFSEYGHVYDSQKQEKSRHIDELRFQNRERSPQEGAVKLEVVFFFGIPKGKKPKEGLRWLPHQKKPDLSNCIKYLEDICNGILFNDDKQIAEIYARKEYALEPRTEFSVIPIKLL